jgi:hypothetical protein
VEERGAAARVTFSGVGVPYTFADLVHLMARLKGDRTELLAGLANFGREIGPMNVHGTPPVSTVTLSVLMAATLLAYPQEDEPYDGRALRTLERPFVVGLCHRAFSIDDEDMSEESGDAWALLRLALRVNGLQGMLQTDTLHEMARSGLLGGAVASQAFNLSKEPAFDDLLMARYGVGAEALFAAHFGLWARAVQHPFVHVPTVLQHVSPGSEADQALRAVLAHYSQTPRDAARALQEGPLAGFRGFSKVFGLFSERPLLRIGPDHYICAPHPLVRLVAQRSSFMAVRGAARADSPASRASVGHLLGERVARYAVHVLARAMPGWEPIDTHGDTVAQGLPDGLLVSSDGAEVLLLEAKARVPPPSVLLGGDRRMLIDTFGRILAQLFKSAHALDGGAAPATALQTRATARVQAAREIHLLGLLPTCPAGLHLPLARSLLMEEAIAMLNDEAQRRWVASALGSGRLRAWHIDGLDAIEAFGMRRLHEHLPAMIVEWQADTERRVRADAFGADELPPTFRDYLACAWASRPGEPLPEIADAYRARVDSVLRLYKTAFGMR